MTSRAEIILARHGETTALPQGPIRGTDLGKWIAAYDAAGIRHDRPAPERLRRLAAAATCVMTSDLRRAIESAESLQPSATIEIDRDLREARLPDSMGASLRLPPHVWKVVARTAWFLRLRGASETVDETQQRAIRAADRLSARAGAQGLVLVVGHRTFNRFLAARLRRSGWRGPTFLRGSFWGTSRFRRERV